MITNEEKWKRIEEIEKKRIWTYHLEEIKKEVAKGNETMRVIHDLLTREINIHNGKVSKQVNKLRNTPTSD